MYIISSSHILVINSILSYLFQFANNVSGLWSVDLWTACCLAVAGHGHMVLAALL
jgi:hypothetical protein